MGSLAVLRLRQYREQRELFGAAKVIQSAWRQYRQVRLSSQRQLEAERTAAVLIQSYYRRYKQFCYFKKLHKSVVFVQKHFRLNKANRHLASSSIQSKTANREERSRDGDHPIRPNRHLASSSIQSNTANREERSMNGDHLIRPNPHLPSSSVPLQLQHEAATCIQHAFRGHYRKRQAAARKIQKFMLESKQKWRCRRGAVGEEEESASDSDCSPINSSFGCQSNEVMVNL